MNASRAGQAAIAAVLLITVLIGTSTAALAGQPTPTTTTAKNSTTTTTTDTPANLLDRLGQLDEREANRLARWLATDGYQTLDREEGRDALVWLLEESARQNPRVPTADLSAGIENARDTLAPSTVNIALDRAAAQINATAADRLADRLPTFDVADVGEWVDRLTPAKDDSSGASSTSDENNTSVPNADYGVVHAIRQQFSEPNGTTIMASYSSRLFVTSTEWHPDGDYAVITIVNTGGPTTISVTDVNDLSREQGAAKMDYREVMLPSGRFQVKVPATYEHGDQTVTIGALETLYSFSDEGGASEPGLLSQVGGWAPWILGGASAFLWTGLAALAVKSSESSEPKEMGTEL